MTTVLQYLVIAAVIGLLVFGLAVVVFGRGEQLAPLSPRSSPTELPDRGIAADDVRKMRFAMSLRGYRMSDVDWALERLASEIERLRVAVTDLGGDPDPAAPEPADGEFAFATVGGPPSDTNAAASRTAATAGTSGTVEPTEPTARPAVPHTAPAAPEAPIDFTDGTRP